MQLKIVFKFFICWNNYQQYSKKKTLKIVTMIYSNSNFIDVK